MDGTWTRVSNSVDSTWGRWLVRAEPARREHKKQLHDRVEERRSQLTATLLGLQSDPQSAKSERASAIESALAALQTHLSGGWDVVDEPESAALTRWLDSSRFLFENYFSQGRADMGEIIDKVKGKAKQIEGIITGDKARQQEGEIDEAKGKHQRRRQPGRRRRYRRG